jgi:hypothetical protein
MLTSSLRLPLVVLGWEVAKNKEANWSGKTSYWLAIPSPKKRWWTYRWSDSCLEKDAKSVNWPANSATKPMPVVYEQATLIEAGRHLEKHLRWHSFLTALRQKDRGNTR